MLKSASSTFIQRNECIRYRCFATFFGNTKRSALHVARKSLNDVIYSVRHIVAMPFSRLDCRFDRKACFPAKWPHDRKMRWEAHASLSMPFNLSSLLENLVIFTARRRNEIRYGSSESCNLLPVPSVDNREKHEENLCEHTYTILLQDASDRIAYGQLTLPINWQ